MQTKHVAIVTIVGVTGLILCGLQRYPLEWVVEGQGLIAFIDTTGMTGARLLLQLSAHHTRKVCRVKSQNNFLPPGSGLQTFSASVPLVCGRCYRYRCCCGFFAATSL